MSSNVHVVFFIKTHTFKSRVEMILYMVSRLLFPVWSNTISFNDKRLGIIQFPIGCEFI